MQYKIVFSDIDGTLLNHDRELSPATISTIKHLKDKLPFVLISARMPSAMRHLQADLAIENQPIICYNGGLILVDGQAVNSTEIPLNTIESLHDFNKNRLDTEVELDFRILRGLSFNVSGEYAWINNQLSVPAGDITDEEQLLNLRQRLTSYSYEVRFGLEFSFGSIYNNVVNPRFPRFF
jgi:hydroxymethylpyrimidine pyrophosphatase-like HAD family hydrolase